MNQTGPGPHVAQCQASDGSIKQASQPRCTPIGQSSSLFQMEDGLQLLTLHMALATMTASASPAS
jgi:hypothetical protein